MSSDRRGDRNEDCVALDLDPSYHSSFAYDGHVLFRPEKNRGGPRRGLQDLWGNSLYFTDDAGYSLVVCPL